MSKTSVPKAIYKTTYCCGLKEIHGVQNRVFDGTGAWLNITPEQVLKDVKTAMRADGYERTPGMFYFVDATSLPYKGGAVLKQYIEDNNLGTVAAVGPHKNPNSGFDITTYVWMVNHDNKGWWDAKS